MKTLPSLDLRRLGLDRLSPRQRQPGTAVLGLSFDGSRLEGAVVRRTNGSVEIKQTFAVSLSLDLLTNDPELVGREIRKHLDAAGVRERRCAVGVPLPWALTLTTPVPALPEADVEGFLHLEAERHFPYGPEALLVARSRFRTPGGAGFATQVAMPRGHIARLEAALRAAQLRPVSFSLGLAAMQRAEGDDANGVVTLAPGEDRVGLQITCGGGVAVLRTIEGAFELTGSRREFQAEHVAREVRITLGQLPPEVRDAAGAAVKTLRILGADDSAEEMAEALRSRVAPLGLAVEQVRTCPPGSFEVRVPSGTAVSPALCLAVAHLARQSTGFEFLPPRVSAWQQFAARYSSQKLVYTGVVAGAAAALVALGLLVQQIRLWHWDAKWQAMRPQVVQLEAMQANIKQYRPWFDESFRSLAILRCLTEAFPEDNSVFAKSVEIRHPGTITCSGTAQDNPALLRLRDKLQGQKEVAAVQVEQTKGSRPMQFTFNFQWSDGGGR